MLSTKIPAPSTRCDSWPENCSSAWYPPGRSTHSVTPPTQATSAAAYPQPSATSRRRRVRDGSTRARIRPVSSGRGASSGARSSVAMRLRNALTSCAQSRQSARWARNAASSAGGNSPSR
jgi:hypothetical protein